MAEKEETAAAEPKEENKVVGTEPEFVFVLRDIYGEMVTSWGTVFGAECYKQSFHISKGDIFKGAKQADAIVSPANSFGFMDGGIDMAYSLYFGWQMQTRLQEVLRAKHNGECLVGKCVVIPAYPPAQKLADLQLDKGNNEGEPIKYLISAPTMRVPKDVSNTCNAYLAFRGVILAARKFNRKLQEEGDKLGLGPIKRILCPGLGTAVGRMPPYRCAFQMKEAFDAFVFGISPDVLQPKTLVEVTFHHENMVAAKPPADKAPSEEPEKIKKTEK